MHRLKGLFILHFSSPIKKPLNAYIWKTIDNLHNNIQTRIVSPLGNVSNCSTANPYGFGKIGQIHSLLLANHVDSIFYYRQIVRLHSTF